MSVSTVVPCHGLFVCLVFCYPGIPDCIRAQAKWWEHKSLKIPGGGQDSPWTADGVMRRSGRLVVLKSLQSRLLKLLQEGHRGMSGMKTKARETFWWPSMDRNIEEHVRGCVECMCSDKTHRVEESPIASTNFPSKPWERVAMDICGPFSAKGLTNKYALVLIDYYSKWPKVAFTGDIKASNVIKFCDQIFRREGCPDMLVTDNGPQFLAEEFKVYLTKMAISHHTTAVYNPRESGLVERFNRVLKECVQLSEGSGGDCKEAVREMLWSYRTTPHLDSSRAGNL